MVRLALAQLSSSEDRGQNLQAVLRAMDEAAARDARLIAFPEVVLGRFFPQESGCRAAAVENAEPIPGPTTEELSAKAAEHGMVVVFNLYEAGAGGRYFDASPVIDADGSLLGTTRMVHITQFEGCFEQDYYDPGDTGTPVYDTAVGRVGVAICYDRHYPEYMRGLALSGAELVVIPQAGTLDEWPEGLFEAEVRTAAFQNGYFVALCNRAGPEEKVVFAGESFVVDPEGRMLARGKKIEDDLVVVDVDLGRTAEAPAKKLFLRHRRPELYAEWVSRPK